MTFRRGGAGKRRDTNEADIIAYLTFHGYRVYQISGRTVPDLLVFRDRRVAVLEVKTKTGKLTAAQADIPWPVVRTPEEALHAVQEAMR